MPPRIACSITLWYDELKTRPLPSKSAACGLDDRANAPKAPGKVARRLMSDATVAVTLLAEALGTGSTMMSSCHCAARPSHPAG
eukprot:7377274-Prymnesium_polylepis.1